MSTEPRARRREVVGVFASRDAFDKAVTALTGAGFSRADLSVLASHDSLDVAADDARSWRSRLVGLVGELKYEGPLVTAGFIAIATGSVGAAIAGLIAAGVGGIAVKELLDEVTAHPLPARFADALAAGDILLWVAAATDADIETANAILTANGAANIHTSERPA